MRKILIFTVCFLLQFTLILPAQTYPSVATFSGTGTPGLTNGSITTALFDHPYGVCSGPAGAIYVADTYNHCIRKIKNGIVTTVAGNGQIGDVDAQGSNARFNYPTGVYYKNGYLYICDNINNKIKRMDAARNVVTIAGSGIQGYADGAALQAQFTQPKSIVVNGNNVVFVADYENHCIRKIANGVVTTLAGIGGVAGDQLGNPNVAKFHRPRDLCLDHQGNVYVVDLMNHKVKKIKPNGKVFLVAGSGIQASIDGVGSAASFSTPVGIDRFPNGDLCVLDAVNPKIRRVTLSGVVTTIAGAGTAGFFDGPSAQAQFDLPQDICFDKNGNLYVGDDLNNRIRVLALDTTSTDTTADSTNISPRLSNSEIIDEPSAVSIYPNPSYNQINIFNENHISDPIEKIMIYSIEGKLVLEQGNILYMDKITIDVSALPTGNYSVVIITQEKKRISLKMVHLM